MTWTGMPCFVVGVYVKDDSMRGATYLHFQDKAVTRNFEESLTLSLGTICSEGVGQDGPLFSFSDSEAPRAQALV